MSAGIVIVNTGSPAAPTPEAVESYLRRFLSDPRIVPMNPVLWRFILEYFILPRRSYASAEKYASIWTDDGSPLDICMSSFAQKLEIACKQDGIDCVFYASSYSDPSIEDALCACREKGCDSVVVVPLYPQSAFSTTEAVRDKTGDALAALNWDDGICFVEGYCDEPSYIAAVAESIKRSGFDADAGDRLLFAFHSIPMADIKAGDTYEEQAQRTASGVANALCLSADAWSIGYQCRFDKSRKWLAPFTTDVLGDSRDANRLFVVAPNFSIDCLETLFDIQQELRKHWEAIRANSNGDASRSCNDFRYVPCLNDSDAHVDVIRNVALSARRCSRS